MLEVAGSVKSGRHHNSSYFLGRCRRAPWSRCCSTWIQAWAPLPSLLSMGFMKRSLGGSFNPSVDSPRLWTNSSSAMGRLLARHFFAKRALSLKGGRLFFSAPPASSERFHLWFRSDADIPRRAQNAGCRKVQRYSTTAEGSRSAMPRSAVPASAGPPTCPSAVPPPGR